MPDADQTVVDPDEQEQRRVAALRRLGALGASSDPLLETAVWLACRICDTPSGALSLVDANRVRLKARVGLDVAELPREHMLCPHAMLADGLLYIPDIAHDPRFASHPVVERLGLRFYAGAALVGTDGHRYGTLCVADTRPRTLDAAQQEALLRLADHATRLLEARRDRLMAESQNRTLVRLIDGIPEGVIACESGGKLRLLNRAAEQWFGNTVGGTPPERWSELIHVTDGQDDEALPLERYPLVRALRGEAVRHQTVVVRSHAHPTFAVSCDAEPFRLDDDEPAGALAILRDVGPGRERVQADGGSDERLQVILQSISEAVIATDRRGRISFANRQAEAMLGLGDGAALGQPFEAVVRLFREKGGSAVPDPVAVVLASGTPSAPVIGKVLKRVDGRFVAVDYRVAPITDTRGTVVGTVAVIHDVSEARQLERRLEHQAAHDALTGLPNRRYLEAALSELVAGTEGGAAMHAGLFIDLDRLKVINDTCGHHAGDLLLQHAARTMRAQLRPGDLLARFGGDEFVAVLRDCTLADATDTAERLREALARSRFHWLGERHALTASIGVVTLGDAPSTDDALSRASAACHLAKEKGQNRIHLHHVGDAELHARQGTMEWVSRIRAALDENRFVLFAQQIAPLHAHAGAPHYEVLVRLCDREGVTVPPMAFIPAAERYGLMPEIDRWVLERALAYLAEQARVGHHPRLSVNVSGATLGMDGLIDFVTRAFERHAVPYDRICFEITETAAVADLERAQAFIRWGRARGCRFALDDFGSGMSSFAYLKQLDVDSIKIDGSFIRQLLDDRVNEAMVIAIRSVASVMGLSTIAEFVETDEIASRLRELDVDFAQGYGVHRPQPLRDLVLTRG